MVLCALTPEGREVLSRLWTIRRHQIDSVADVLSLDDLAKVVEAMELLTTAFAQSAPAVLGGAASPDTAELVGQSYTVLG
jgi:predicted MarR family transcription regulator